MYDPKQILILAMCMLGIGGFLVPLLFQWDEVVGWKKVLFNITFAAWVIILAILITS